MLVRNISLALLSLALVVAGASAEQKKKPLEIRAGRTPMAPSAEDLAAAAAAQQAAAIASAPKVGGVAMLPTRSITENAALAPNLSTLTDAVKAAGLDATLGAPGAYTIFAPTNDAFARLAPGTVTTLLKPENKALLTRILTYHAIQGAISGADLQAKIAAEGGTTRLMTIEGEPITATLTNGAITLTDVNGNKSYIEQYDVKQANGVVHVVNGVLLPKVG